MKLLPIIFAVIFSSNAMAQTSYSPLPWGINKLSNPYQVGVNINNTWSNIATISNTGVWNIPTNNIYYTFSVSGAQPTTQSVINIDAPVSPEMFYPNAGTGGDDTLALQTWANYIVTTGSEGILTRGKTYLHSSTIVFKPQVYDGFNPPYSPPSGILFIGYRPFRINGNGAEIKATSYMSSQFKFIFNSSISSISPFMSSVHDIFLNGNNFTSSNIFSNYTFGLDIHHNRMNNSYYNINFEGYGVHNISNNFLKGTIPIYGWNGGLNDSNIVHNDIYPSLNCMQLDQNVVGSGNINFANNICTVESGSANGVFINAAPYPSINGSSGSSGSLSTNTYYIQVTGTQIEDNNENYIYNVSTPISVTGPSGSISITTPNNADFTYNIYIGTTSSPGNLAKIGTLQASGLSSNTSYIITGIGNVKSPPSNPINANISIANNLFSAISSASINNSIYAVGVSGANNLDGLKISENTMISSGGGGGFAFIQNATDISIIDNSINYLSYLPVITGNFINFSNVTQYKILNNDITRMSGQPILCTNCVFGNISNNTFRNVGNLTNTAVSTYFGTSTNNTISNNSIYQDGSGYATYGFTETSGSNYNQYLNNIFTSNVSNKYVLSGPNSKIFSISGSFTTTGSSAINFTSTNTTSLTLPTYGTIISNPAASYLNPSISSGFGSSAYISENNGSTAFRINIGTGGTAYSGVIAMPTADHGWNCFSSDYTNPANASVIKMSASTASSVTLTNYSTSTGLPTPWTSGDIIIVNCLAY